MGTVITEIAKLTSLVYLGLAQNFLHGTIPTNLNRLTMLSSLDLGKPEIGIATFFSCLDCAHKLYFLIFDSNNSLQPIEWDNPHRAWTAE